ncbi:MAG TPA: LysR family transcriptional regulator [Miltoncostaeaceae bacterium]|nr:LysR family transcriptional regulator [Miltoncostaeaceae bacterium]
MPAIRGLIRPPELAEALALVAAVEEGSLARAGARIGVSQPAMTKRIRSLEALVGVPLLERSRRGVRPTDAGRRLYADALQLLAAAERFGASAASLRGAGALRIAVIYTLAEARVARWLGAHRGEGEEAPPVEVRVGQPAQVRDWVAHGDSDLGFAAAPVPARPELVERAFARDELVAAVPPGHAWAAAGAVAATELLAAPLAVREPGSGTRRTLDDAVARAGLPAVVPALTLASNQAIRDAAAGGRAVGILSRMAIDALRAVPVTGLDLARELTCMWRRDARLSAEQRRFLAVAGAQQMIGAAASASAATAAAAARRTALRHLSARPTTSPSRRRLRRSYGRAGRAVDQSAAAPEASATSSRPPARRTRATSQSRAPRRRDEADKGAMTTASRLPSSAGRAAPSSWSSSPYQPPRRRRPSAAVSARPGAQTAITRPVIPTAAAAATASSGRPSTSTRSASPRWSPIPPAVVSMFPPRSRVGGSAPPGGRRGVNTR